MNQDGVYRIAPDHIENLKQMINGHKIQGAIFYQRIYSMSTNSKTGV